MRLCKLYIVVMLFLGACTGAWENYPPSVNDVGAIDPVLQVGDVLTVSVYGEDTLTGDYTVSTDGTITMPLAGAILVKGLTVAQAGTNITQSLTSGGYLINPEVVVSMTKDRMFSIMGEVLNAGEYEYKDGMTVLDAVAKGGGFSYRANQTKFDIVRKMPNGSEDVIHAQLSSHVSPNDIIRVRERYF